MSHLLTLLQAQTPTPATDSISVAITEKLKTLSQMSGHDLLNSFLNTCVHWGLKVLAAIVIYFIGRWLIRYTQKILTKMMNKRKFDASLSTFLRSFIKITLTVILVVVIVSILGVPTSTFAALLAAGGVAIGMALSGTLQNFAGGIMILLFRPFKVGDYIDTSGLSGTVDEINITTTQIHTVDNKIIIIPNGTLAGNNIQNYTAAKIRRVDWSVNIAYGDDAQKCMDLLKSYLNKDTRILKDPAEPFTAIDSLQDSSIKIIARAWCKSEDYWDLYFEMNKIIYEELPKQGIHFPFPQLEVSVKNDGKLG